MRLKKFLAVVLGALIILGPCLGALSQFQTSPEHLARQAQIVLANNPFFWVLQAQFLQNLGKGPSELLREFREYAAEAEFHQAKPGLRFAIFKGAKDLNMMEEVVRGGKAPILGIIDASISFSLGGQTFPAGRYGVVAMKGSLVFVLINLATGQIIAFILLPAAALFGIFFFPVILVFQVIFQLVIIIGFPPIFFPPFPFFGCPALPFTIPISVFVSSGGLLLSVPGAFAVSDAGLGLLRLQSLGPALQFQLFAPGQLWLGFLGASASTLVRIPFFHVPFVLMLSGGGKTGCISAAVFFPGVISGMAGHN